ncbi:hypothetical protein DAETH_32830 (plasmid) [Deinococcus aetherius]|uniref:Uncharacterized protein n=1 Tax=Deinococcus aetherius TaxID=200252 RepID=A0ABN6RKR3_9DEIO|nr:hypothetical protein DAETH_32830 [Deinococcus aetherius]
MWTLLRLKRAFPPSRRAGRRAGGKELALLSRPAQRGVPSEALEAQGEACAERSRSAALVKNRRFPLSFRKTVPIRMLG